MKLSDKTITKLRILINEETEYRSGPMLISFFEQLGFHDKYGQGFPSRWKYTENNLNRINGTPEIDKCIKLLFDPINYIDNQEKLNFFIKDFNKYIAFDGWQIKQKGKDIFIVRADESDWLKNQESKVILNDSDFLNIEFPETSITGLKIDPFIKPILESRFIEAKINITSNSPLSAIIQCGSILEGILLSLANSYPDKFNICNSAPKDINGKVKKFNEWTLSDFINTSYELQIIKEDVKKFSHVLRDFRNYIHPYQQLGSGFSPDINTAKICLQVLKAACMQISNFTIK